MDVFDVKLKDFLPGRTQGFVFSMSGKSVIAEFHYGEGIGFSAQVGRGQAFGLEDFDHQVAYILDCRKGLSYPL